MPVAQSGQAVALVGLGIFLVANAHHGRFQQPNYRSQHFLARQPAACQVILDPRPDLRQHFAEHQQLAVLAFVAHFAPARVVAILLPAACITADRLQMTIGPRTDPYMLIGGRDRQLADACQRFFFGDLAAIGRAILEAIGCTDATDPGRAIADVAESGRAGSSLQFGGVGSGKRCGNGRHTADVAAGRR